MKTQEAVKQMSNQTQHATLSSAESRAVAYAKSPNHSQWAGSGRYGTASGNYQESRPGRGKRHFCWTRKFRRENSIPFFVRDIGKIPDCIREEGTGGLFYAPPKRLSLDW